MRSTWASKALHAAFVVATASGMTLSLPALAASAEPVGGSAAEGANCAPLGSSTQPSGASNERAATVFVEPPVPADASAPADAGAPKAQATMRADAGVTTAAEHTLPERIAGHDRFGTAAMIANQFGTADAVIVANGGNAKGGFDALSANFLAGELHAPVLLTDGKTLGKTTADAVRRVLTGSKDPQVYVMGREDSVSSTVATALGTIATDIAGAAGKSGAGSDTGTADDSAPPRVHRLGGESRYGTSYLAATAVDDAGAGSIDLGEKPDATLPTAILASGMVNADALAAGPISYAWHLPVILTQANRLSDKAAATIEKLGIQQLVVLGGADRVSERVVQQALSAGVKRHVRVAGGNRFQTAVRLYHAARATWTTKKGQHYGGLGSVFLANGISGFPDALAAGPLAGKYLAPLLTVNSDAADSATLNLLHAGGPAFTSFTALGTASTVGEDVLIAAKAAAGVNIAQRNDGTMADDINEQYLAKAKTLDSFNAKLALARSDLPHDGAAIATLYPCLNDWGKANDAAGVTMSPGCVVWIANNLPDSAILDVLRHEYIHALQCREGGKYGAEVAPGRFCSSPGNVERIADAGAYLLGGTYLYYVDYCATGVPLRASEIHTARQLFALFHIPVAVG